jgi:hypothetical protein
MKLMKLKKKGMAPLSAQAAVAVGGLLLAWGYRRWSRRKTERAEARRSDAELHSKADTLSGKFHSLDQGAATGRIPKGLERSPKNLEQSEHPG